MLALAIAAIGVIAATCAFARPRRLRDFGDPGAPLHPPAISVVVPARNEAANLPALLDSLAASSIRPDAIIVVDDNSSDDTAAVARARGAHVVSAPALPAGWVGKNWACHLGAAAASSDHLLFLDADTRVAPLALSALVQCHRAVEGLVSVQPFHRTVRPYEELSALFNAVSLLGTGAFALWPTPAVEQRMAFGPCLFTTRADYVSSGGHEAVRSEVVEDIALAGRYADAGRPVTCGLGGELIWFRMYPGGVRELVQGWTKNIALGARRAPKAPTALAVAWVVALASVAGATIAAVVMWVTGGPIPIAEAVAWLVVTIHLGLLLRRIGSFRWLTAALFPVPLACFIVVFIRSAYLSWRGRPAIWRGRDVSLHPGVEP